MGAYLLYGYPQESFFETYCLVEGKEPSFLVPEGRPHLWGAREVALQAANRGWPVRLITDNMMAYCFSKGMIETAYIFSQQDTEGGICGLSGALIVAIAAKAHGVPVKALPAAKALPPSSDAITEGLFSLAGIRTAPPGIKGYVPLVEFVPWKYLTAANGSLAIG